MPGAPADEVLEVEANLRQHGTVLAGAAHAFLPHGAVRVEGAELAREDVVEVLDVVLGPLDAG